MTTQKNICIIIPALMSCGVTTAVINLARALKNENAKVHLISLTSSNEVTIPLDITIHHLYNNKIPYRKLETRGSIASDAKVLKELISRITNEYGNFDLFLSNTAWVDRIMVECDYPNTYHIIHESVESTWKNISLFRGKKYRCWRWFKALSGRQLISVSEGIAEGIIKNKKINPASLRVIYNTFDIDNVITKKNEIISDVPKDDYIIHAGRFCKEKRYDILFCALKILSNVKLVLLVKHPEKAKKLAKKYGVIDNVVIIDFQENPFPWIASAKLLVLSSDTEGLGMVLIESLICGTPIVSTDCDYGPREILTGSLKEYLVPINNPQALADKIRKALHSYPDITKAEVIEKFYPENVAKHFLALCDKNNFN